MVCIFADKNVGKKSLGESGFVNDIVNMKTGITLGISFFLKDIELYGENFRINLWIFSPNKHFEKMQIMQVRLSNGIILLYDITNRKSLNWLSKWSYAKENVVVDDIPILLVGNKLDLEEVREVSKEQAEIFKEKNNLSSSMEISIKTGKNVEEMFKNITRMVITKFNPEIIDE